MIHIPFFSLRRQNAELRSSLDKAHDVVLERSDFITGPELERFEIGFARYCGVRHAIGVANGLDALSLILRALRIGPGDEVIVPGHTFIATWLAVDHVGALVVPVDVDLSTFNIDPKAVASAITERTRAIIAVHLYGRPANIDALRSLVGDRDIPIVEDAAQAHGALYAGERVGSLGLAAGFSFYPTKNLGALGDGGAVTTNNDAVADAIRDLRNYGSRIKYHHSVLGVNSRLDEIQAAYLNVKLPTLDKKNARRREIVEMYNDGLRGVPDLALPKVDNKSEPAWHLYVVRVQLRDRFQTHLAAKGIQTMIHYPIPPHRQPAYSGERLRSLHLPNTEQVATQVLSLPLWPELKDTEVKYVIEEVREACESFSERA